MVPSRPGQCGTVRGDPAWRMCQAEWRTYASNANTINATALRDRATDDAESWQDPLAGWSARGLGLRAATGPKSSSRRVLDIPLWHPRPLHADPASAIHWRLV